jgi:REP element-mobilizing transposase RayT
MTQARKRLVSLSDTPYYHCVSRCVRRAFLCGKDPLTGFDFEHRRQWIVDRINLLAEVFAVDVCAYAVMSNHYHVVLYIDSDQCRRWTDREVALRWCRIFSGPLLVQRWLDGESLSAAECDRVSQFIEVWRQRLISLSWYMRCLNEAIARLANQEDRCTGRFWEGRFKSQALLDEKALLACMAYVDLNPIRATMAKTPERSDFTSIQQRIKHPKDHGLRRFAGHSDDLDGIPYSLMDYVQLVEWSGRVMREGKKGFIPPDTPPILSRLGMAPDKLLEFVSRKQGYPRAIGPLEQVRQLARELGGRFFKGLAVSKRLYAKPV